MALLLTSKRRKRLRSSALILTLAAMVLLTVLILAFLSRAVVNRQISAAYVAQSQSDSVANTALQITVGDLRDEITAGSTNYAASTAGGTTVTGSATISGNTYTNSFTVYQPASAYSVRPQVIPSEANPVNLIKMSSSGAAFWNTTWTGGTVNGPERAIASNTGTSSRNRSGISAARWNLPCLLTAAPTTLPDWCLIQRSGAYNSATPPLLSDVTNSAPTNLKFVTGRYAYMIYDEGALLDANVAGNNLGSSDDANMRRGRLYAADISQIPGVTAANAITLTSWRNPTPKANWLENPTNNFTSINQDQQAGEQMFVRRQDLISYSQNNPGVLPPSSLPYLGTFTRQQNSPSWRPASLTNSTINYNAIADTASSANRDASNVRVQVGFVRSSDGTLALPGDPQLKTRFPLSRLALVTDTATATATSDIYHYFGLVRSSAGATPWVYRPDSSGKPATSVLTLDQVAAAGREPDFFELLKAGMLSGSLAKYSAVDIDLVCGYLDQSADLQILQTGANVISQYRTDTNPVAIQFQVSTAFAGSAGGNVVTTVYGIENFPYIDTIYDSIFRPNQNKGTPQTSYDSLEGWLQFQLWNPHQNAPSAPSTQFRIVATDGMTRVSANSTLTGGAGSENYNSAWLPLNGDCLYFTASGSDFAEPRLLVPNQATSGQASGPSNNNIPGVPVIDASTSAPVTGSVSEQSYRTVTGSDNLSTFYFGTTQQPSAYNSTSIVYSPCYLVGFPMGSDPLDAVAGAPATRLHGKDNNITGVASDPNPMNYYHIEFSAGSGGHYPTFNLQYLDSSNTWRTYQTIESNSFYNDRLGQSGYASCMTWLAGMGPGSTWGPAIGNSGTTPGLGLSYGAGAFLSMDPRSKRGGMPRLNGMNVWIAANQTLQTAFWNNYISTQSDAGTPAQNNFPFDPSGTNIHWGNKGDGGFQPGDLSYNMSTASFVTDPDNVQRRADGYEDSWWPSTWARPEDETISGLGAGYGTPLYGVGNSARPAMLNRPFRSVAEMGYAMRGDPWKSLNFWSNDSADAGLLDLFTVDDAPVVAGRVSLNTPYPQVLESILTGEVKNDNGPASPVSMVTPAEAASVAAVIVNNSKITPYANVSELVTRIGDALDVTLAQDPTVSGAPDGYIKERHESIVRALGNVADTRTWNLMIDVIAQAGRYPPNAKSLDDFIVEGERRYWLHIAIDRYTGQIVGQQLEPVYE